MKQSDVVIGSTYLARVSGNLVSVRVDRVRKLGGTEGTGYYTRKWSTDYSCTNLATGRTVIKTASALRPAPVKLTLGFLNAMAALHVGSCAVVRVVDPNPSTDNGATFAGSDVTSELYRVDAPIVALPAMRTLWENLVKPPVGSPKGINALDRFARISTGKLDGPTAGLCSVVVRVYL